VSKYTLDTANELLAENAQLGTDVYTLRRRVKELEAELARLREQEPVAFRIDPGEGPSGLSFMCPDELRALGCVDDIIPLYTAPPTPLVNIPSDAEFLKIYCMFANPTLGARNALKSIRAELLRLNSQG